jgi:enoyl-CoA hydratase/carnithine racemase
MPTGRGAPATVHETIAVEVSDRVATVTLNRPDELNTYTVRMKDDLVAAFDAIDADDGVAAVVVTGSGRAFCAGMDLSDGPAHFIRADEPEEDRQRDSGGILTLRIFQSTKPVIAAINGAAIGVGVTMTLPMDIRLASTSARFGFVFTRVGIVLESCSSWFLPRIVGVSRAAEWAYTGRVFDAAEAHAAGLVRSIHPPGELLSAARAVAREIADHAAPVSVSLNRQLLWRMLTASHPMEAHLAESRAMLVRGTSADCAEGVGAFLQKRPAAFAQTVPADLPDIFDADGGTAA